MSSFLGFLESIMGHVVGPAFFLAVILLLVLEAGPAAADIPRHLRRFRRKKEGTVNGKTV
ncbi:MAG: hypothetical protein ABSF56_00710 [Minisyncoccia bacterium]